MSMTGISGVVGKLRVVQQNVKKGRNAGAFAAGSHILGVSNERVPHEDGDLERSGTVSQDDETGLTAISYDTEYAVVQHEVEELQHDAGRQAKFLESAMTGERETALQIMATSIKKEAGL